MPLKMIGFILALVILVTFVGLNWENSSDIDLWFNQLLHFEDVSIVLSFMIVYLAGMLSSIPFWLDLNIQKKKKEKKKRAAALSPAPIQKDTGVENLEDPAP